MAEEPDGGRDSSDWEGLASAVRRVDADRDADSASDSDADRGDAGDESATDEPASDESTTDDSDGSELTPAVRRVTGERDSDAVNAVGDSSDGGDSSDDSNDGGLERVDRDGWRDLTPAVERVEDEDGDEWEWSVYDTAGGDDLEPAASSDLQLVPDEEHQAEEPAEPDQREDVDDDALDPRENTVMDADETLSAADDGIGMNAPETDVEQPLAVHVEEMIKRLAIVIAVAGLVSVAVFPVTESLITTIWNYVLPGGEAVDPRVYHPLELIITQLKVASLAGLVIALPVFVYQSYAFMRPGLYKNERRYYLAAVPTSLVLAVLGVLFAYLLVLPYTMDYFQGYTEGTADVAFALGTTFNLILMVMGYLAVVFQIPLFIMLAIMLGVTTRKWLEDRRLLFWAAFAGISFTFGAIDPTGIVPILVALTMIALFETTLALLRWTGN
jgi:sec-independent protein translocase protein TatC